MEEIHPRKRFTLTPKVFCSEIENEKNKGSTLKGTISKKSRSQLSVIPKNDVEILLFLFFPLTHLIIQIKAGDYFAIYDKLH